MLALLLLTGAPAGGLQSQPDNSCSDLHGAPLASAPDLASCASYLGQCDAPYLSTREKATLLLHCPATCGATKYRDGGGKGYCAYTAGHDTCFDEPPDCATRKPTTVVEHVMCRKTLGLCSGRGRRADECGEGYGAVQGLLRSHNEQNRRTVSLVQNAPGLQAGHMPLDPVVIRQAMEALK